jgi:threonine dehydrogenase-like Zn-dependent dehydrogenase
MADGRVNGEEMITKKISLTDLVAEGFEELIRNVDKHIKIMVYPD